LTPTISEPATHCPSTAEELTVFLRDCSNSGTPVACIGGGTKRHIGRAIADTEVEISTSAMGQVHHYDPGDLTVGVGAGMTLGCLQQMLAERGQFLPLDPMLPAQATIGGILAANAHGPLKAGYGGVRDFCIGIEFATAEGLVAKAGGKVVKNVAGYDLMKLMVGSLGTLGVITAANFKVFPKPANTCTFLARFARLNDALGYRDRLRKSLGNSFLAMELISPRAHEYFVEHDVRDPDDYSPAKPTHGIHHWTVATRVNGSDKVIDRYRRELRTHDLDEVRQDQEFWARISDFEVNVRARHRNAMVLYVNAPIAQIKDVLDAAEEVAPLYTMLHASIGRITMGNLVVCLMPLAVDPPSAVAFANTVSALRARVSAEVSIVAARCPEESKLHFDVWGSSPTDMSLMAAVKSAMDPKNILNRGRYIVG
jgi:FAD/FMN-containing dehydrogenase